MTEIMENTKQGIAIVGGIANIAVLIDKKFTFKELAQLLTAFGHFTSEGKDYADPKQLIDKAIVAYIEVGDTRTANDIKTRFVSD